MTKKELQVYRRQLLLFIAGVFLIGAPGGISNPQQEISTPTTNPHMNKPSYRKLIAVCYIGRR